MLIFARSTMLPTRKFKSARGFHKSGQAAILMSHQALGGQDDMSVDSTPTKLKIYKAANTQQV